jgi:ubiquitin C-terminal hydrolase
MIDDEIDMLEMRNNREKEHGKKEKLSKEKRYSLFQRSLMFKTFGFRTIKHTACLKCKHTSRQIELNLDIQVPLKFPEKYQMMQPQECIRIFNPLHFNKYWDNCCLNFLCCC